MTQDQAEPSDRFVLLIGLLMAEDSFQIAPGLTLEQIGAEITVFDLAAAGVEGFRYWSLIEPLLVPSAAEIRSTGTTADGAMGRAWLVSALLLLRGFHRQFCPAQSAYSWRTLSGAAKDRRKLAPFKGGLLDYHTDWLVPDDTALERMFTSEDALWIGQRFASFEKLGSSNQRFKFALESAVDWRFSKEPRAGVARLWSGIESLFDVSQELKYRISLMAASVLESRGPGRLQKFQAIKKLYDLRSKAVHGAPIAPKVLDELLRDSFDLLRWLLLDAAERGSPRSEDDFNEAIFH